MFSRVIHTYFKGGVCSLEYVLVLLKSSICLFWAVLETGTESGTDGTVFQNFYQSFSTVCGCRRPTANIGVELHKKKNNRVPTEHLPAPLQGTPRPGTLCTAIYRLFKWQRFLPDLKPKAATFSFTVVNSNTRQLSWGAMNKPTPSHTHHREQPLNTKSLAPLEELGSRAQAIYPSTSHVSSSYLPSLNIAPG